MGTMLISEGGGRHSSDRTWWGRWWQQSRTVANRRRILIIFLWICTAAGPHYGMLMPSSSRRGFSGDFQAAPTSDGGQMASTMRAYSTGDLVGELGEALGIKVHGGSIS